MSGSHSIANRLSLSIITAVALLFVITLSGIFGYALKEIWKETEDRAASTLMNVQGDIESILGAVENSARNISWVVEENKGDSAFLFHLCEQFLRQNDNAISARIAFEPFLFPGKGEFCSISAFRNTENGAIEPSEFTAEEYDYFTMDWYLLPKLLSRSSWSEPTFREGSTDMITTFSIPMRDEYGVVYGVFAVDIYLNALKQQIAQLMSYEKSYAFVLGANGSFISHKDDDKILGETIFSRALEMGQDELYQAGLDMINHRCGNARFTSEDSSEEFMVYRPLSNGWSAGIVFQFDEVFAQVKIFSRSFGAVFLIVLLMLYFICRKIVNKITEPISEFTYSALSLAQGNFSAKIPEIKSQDELRHLQDSLHYLESSIGSYIKELKVTTASNERFESELTIASNIQMNMLTKDFPERNDLDIYASLTPAKEVGGDLYDFFILDNKLYFAIGDVSGKGVPAALFMAITRSAFRFISKLGLSVEGIASHINNAFAEGNDSSMFVTMFVGCIDLVTYEMKYCNSGHNPIVIVRPDGKASYLHAKPNLAAGLFEGFPYRGESLFLQSGCRLLLYTDGVTEAETRSKDQYGEERLLDFAASNHKDVPSREFVDKLTGSVKEFTCGNEPNDDITIMSILLK